MSRPTRHFPLREPRYVIWRPTRHHRAHITNGYRGARPGTVKAVCGFEGLFLGGAVVALSNDCCSICLKSCQSAGVSVEGIR